MGRADRIDESWGPRSSCAVTTLPPLRCAVSIAHFGTQRLRQRFTLAMSRLQLRFRKHVRIQSQASGALPARYLSFSVIISFEYFDQGNQKIYILSPLHFFSRIRKMLMWFASLIGQRVCWH